MITPELIAYIRGEFTKGKTRGEIHETLISEGGWNEADLSEAFRTIMPMQSSPPEVKPNPVYGSYGSVVKSSTPAPAFVVESSPLSYRKIFLVILICVVVGGSGAIWWFRPPIVMNINVMGMWDSLINKITQIQIPKIHLPFWGAKTTDDSETVSILEEQAMVPVENIGIRDCGTGIAPNLNNPNMDSNNFVLDCLGNSALYCENAQAILTNDLFPNIFQIIKNQDTCDFKLSYSEDSTLVDVTGKKSAGQYILCPINIVKRLDESNLSVPVFKEPNVNNLSQYASQIYFYGTLGLFMENNVEQNKIQALGCSGSYIDSMIASYNKMQQE